MFDPAGASAAAKRGLSTGLNGRKSFYHIGGLTEGSETLLAFALACMFPSWFSAICYVFGTLCFVTGGTRIGAALVHFREPSKLPLPVPAGHFRNGILFAPAIADVLSNLVLARRPMPKIAAFDPKRFQNGTNSVGTGSRPSR